MKALKNYFNKHKEIIMYLIFGVSTTLVGLGSYFLILNLGIAIGFTNADGDPTNLLRLVAQILHWVFAVLFAFFTNKKWVFEEAKELTTSTAFQLVEFAGSRLLTLLLDTVVTFGTVWILEAVSYEQFWIFTCDVIAKIAAAVLVTIANYFLSKFWVFKKR